MEKLLTVRALVMGLLLLLAAGCGRKDRASGPRQDTRTSVRPAVKPVPHPPPGPLHPMGPPRGHGGQIQRHLFPPELIIQGQSRLGLEPEQRQAIIREIQRAHSVTLPLRWEMHQAMELLIKQLKQPRVSEAKALAAADRFTTLERKVKRTQLELLIRIKNQLTPQQQSRLVELRHRPRW